MSKERGAAGTTPQHNQVIDHGISFVPAPHDLLPLTRLAAHGAARVAWSRQWGMARALVYGCPVLIAGATLRNGRWSLLLCYAGCCVDRAEAVVLPDLTVIEMIVNGQQVPAADMLAGEDGRSVLVVERRPNGGAR